MLLPFMKSSMLMVMEEGIIVAVSNCSLENTEFHLLLYF